MGKTKAELEEKGKSVGDEPPKKRSNASAKSKAKAELAAAKKEKADPAAAKPKAKAKAKVTKEPKESKAVKEPKAPKVKKSKAEAEGGVDNEQTGEVITTVLRDRQKYPTPPNGDGTRAFYETILEEIPYSAVAVRFCVEHGVLQGTRKAYCEALYDILKQQGFTKILGHGVMTKELEKNIQERIKLNAENKIKTKTVKNESK